MEKGVSFQRHFFGLDFWVHYTDPFHPRLFVTYNVQKLAVFADSADVLAEDYYPIGEPYQTVNGTGTVAQQVQLLANRHMLASALVLQSHSLGEYRAYASLCHPFPRCMPYPTVGQMRQMRDLVLQNAHPRLILWYSFFDLLKSDDPVQRWSNLINAAGTGSAPLTIPLIPTREAQRQEEGFTPV